MSKAEKAEPFPIDAYLRKWGWRIHARPKGKEPLWARRGEVRTQKEALRIVRAERN